MALQKVRSSGNIFNPGDIIRGPAGWLVVTQRHVKVDHVEYDTYPVDEHIANLEAESVARQVTIDDLSANLTKLSGLLDAATDQLQVLQSRFDAPVWRHILYVLQRMVRWASGS